jgi:hypothetical protein
MNPKAITKKYLFEILNRDKLLSQKRPEDLSSEDLYAIGRKFLFFVMTQKRLPIPVIEVAGRVLSLFQRMEQAKQIDRWQGFRVTEGFLMRNFLPTLYEQFKAKGIDIDLKLFYERALGSDLSTPEMKKVGLRAWEESAMDDLLDGPPVELKEEVQQQFRYREDLIPVHLKNRPEDELTESEIATIAKLKLLSCVLSGKIDKISIGAAYKLVSNFQQDIKGDSEKLWFEVIRPLESFYLTVLCPTIHREYQLRKDYTPINLIFADAMAGLIPILENLQDRNMGPTEFDEAIAKAKRRGKWIKKTKKGEDGNV